MCACVCVCTLPAPSEVAVILNKGNAEWDAAQREIYDYR